MISKLSFISIPVADQQRALSFYRDKLGFEVAADNPMGDNGGDRWIELRPPGGGEATICLFTPPGHRDRVGSFLNGAFSCPDVDALHQMMVDREVEVVDPPSDQGWGRMLLFNDSEGNTICVTSDTDANRT